MRPAAPPSGAERTGVVTATVSSILARAYELYCDETAIVWPDGARSTYGELGGIARRLAGGLHAHGLTAGDRVMIMTKNRPESFCVDHALLSGGLVRVALSYRLHPLEVVKIARD